MIVYLSQCYEFYDVFKLNQAHAASLLEFQCSVSVFHWHEHVLKFSLYSKVVFLEKKKEYFGDFVPKRLRNLAKKKSFFSFIWKNEFCHNFALIAEILLNTTIKALG